MSELTGIRIGRQVGAGGTATVHLATTAEGDTVAAKVFSVTTPVARVHQEAAMAAAVAHPHVARVRGVIEGAAPVLVTEWAPRGSLLELLTRRRRLSPGETVTVAAALADVLQHAEGLGVVHGDLCAANLVFAADGRPMLVDFGSARRRGDLSAAVAVTPTDLAPEVARGGLPDHRSDLFGLGSVMMHCLTGRPAWAAADVRDVVVQSTVGQWPDPGPGELAELVRSLLHEDPARRPAPSAVLARLRAMDPPEPVEFPEPVPDPTTLDPDTVGPGPACPDGPNSAVPVPPAAVGRHALPDEPEPESEREPERSEPRPSDPRERETGGESASGSRAAPGHPAHGAADPRDRAEAGGRDRWPDPSGVVTQLRLPRVTEEPEAPGRSRRRVLAIAGAATVVVLTLIVAAILTLREAAVADEVAPTASRTSAGVDTPGETSAPSMTPEVGSPSSTVPLWRATSQPEVTGSPGTSGAVASSVLPSPPSPDTSAAGDPTAVTGDPQTVDWLPVVAELDDRRAHALVTRDVEFLELVYVLPCAAADADARTVRDLLAAGRRLSDAAHVVTSAQWQSTEEDGAVRLLVVDELPSYPILGADGATIGSTTARATAEQVMVLEPTAQGYRIRSVGPAGTG